MAGADETPLAARRGHPHPEASRIAVADVEGSPEQKQRLDAASVRMGPGMIMLPNRGCSRGSGSGETRFTAPLAGKITACQAIGICRFRWWCGSPGFGLQSQVSGPPLRQALNRGFLEPTSIRAGSSACRTSSYRASAPSDCDRTENDNRATCPPEPAWGASGSRRCRLSVASTEDSTSGTAMGLGDSAWRPMLPDPCWHCCEPGR